MIDEGHDFEKDWLALIVQMIDPNTDSLLLLYDDAQSIYSRSTLKFSLSSAGIQARGRTTILKLNYRNTREILTFAYDFAREHLTAQEADDDHVPLIEPEVAGANGPPPVYRQFNTTTEEANYIARCVTKWHKDGQPLKEIAIIYSQHWQAEQLSAALAAAGMPSAVLTTTKEKKTYDPAKAQVTLLTRHSSKGLEFNTVVLTGLGALKDDAGSLAQETRLLYVGMTRARQQLLVTSSGVNLYTERLAALVGEAA